MSAAKTMEGRPFQTQGGRVYERLCAEISTRQLKPGAYVPLRDVAARFGVSVSAARDAVRLLHERGLLEKVPKYGFRVCAVTRERVEGYFVVRRALLVESARLATPRITEADVEALSAIASRLDALIRMGRYVDTLDLDMEFHVCVARIAGLPFLAREVSRLNTFDVILPAPPPDSNWPSHERVIEALASRDPARAAQAMCDHVENAMNNTLASLSEIDTAEEKPQ